MRTLLGLLLLATLVHAEDILIRNLHIHTGTGEVIRNGEVLLSGAPFEYTSHVVRVIVDGAAAHAC